jgi:hypothetical protein
MFEHRITRYDPARRNQEGRHPQDGWTSFSDLGTKVSLDEYELSRGWSERAIAQPQGDSIASLSVPGDA